MREGVVVQLAGGEIVACNPAAERILGLTRDQMAGRTSVDPRWRSIHEDGTLFPGETHPAMVTLRTGQAVRDVVMGIHQPDGTLRWISISSEPIPGPDGRPASVVTTFDDVTERRRAEAALHESENEFRRIVETANEGIWQVDAGSRTSFVNRRMAEMLGYAPEELLGRPPSDFVVVEERADVERRMAIARQGLPDSYERRFLRRDGSEVWTLLKSSPVRSPDGALAGLLAMVSDITERKSAEEAIRRSEENLRSYFEAFDDCVFVLDGDGAILHVNRIVTTRLGWEPHELVGRSVLEVHPEERREEAARIVAAMLAGKARSCPVPLLTKNGKRIPVETRVFPGRWNGRDVLFGLSKDLSQLRASEEKFQKAFRHNPSPMVIRSIPTGKIIDVNEAFTEMLGYPREAVVGKTSIGIGATLDAARQSAAEALLSTQGSFRDFEMDARTADGRILHGLFSGEMIELQDDRLFLTVMKDVTELRNAELELRRHREHLEELVAERTGTLSRTERELRTLSSELEQRVAERTKALANATAYNRSLIEASLDPMLTGDRDGRITDVNEASIRATGHSRESLIGSDFSNYFADPGKAREGFARVFRDGIVRNYELQLKQRDGSVVPVECNATLYRDADGGVAGLFAAARDITERKRFEEALGAGRELLRQILDLVPQAIFWKDETSVYLGCNRTFALAAGLTDPEQIVGKTDLDLPWNREEAEAYRADDAQVVGSGIPKRHIVERQRQADGTELWIETNKVPMLDGTGRPKGVLGVFEDINERKQAEIALLRSENRFREVLESSVDASYKRDLLADRYAYMSPVVERISGYTSAELTALPLEALLALFHPEDRARVERVVAEALSSGAATPIELRYRFRHKSGQYRCLQDQFVVVRDTRGEPSALIGSVSDITERKRAEDALAEAEEQLRTFFDRSPIGKAIATPEGRLLRVNDAYCNMLGLSQDELLNRTFQSLLHPDDFELTDTTVRSVLAGTTEEVDVDLRHLTRDGRVIWTHVRGAILRDSAGEPVQLMAHILDISQRKAAELAIRESHEKLEERVAERTAALVEANRELEGYSYSVSHELRTPLRAIDGHSAMIASDYDEQLDDDGRHHLAALRWNAQRMGRLIDDLLDFSRTGRADLAIGRVDMTSLATESFATIVSDPAVQTRISFSVLPLPYAAGDAALLRRVWENLLSNAVKFSAGRQRPEIRVEGNVEADELVYRVRDNGVGFDMTYADKLFGVFQRLHGHREFEGTGVGLALARRIVGRHGGRTWAEGEVDRGATFSFSLPLKAGHP